MNKKGCLYIPTKQHYATFLLSTKKEKYLECFGYIRLPLTKQKIQPMVYTIS